MQGIGDDGCGFARVVALIHTSSGLGRQRGRVRPCRRFRLPCKDSGDGLCASAEPFGGRDAVTPALAVPLRCKWDRESHPQPLVVPAGGMKEQAKVLRATRGANVTNEGAQICWTWIVKILVNKSRHSKENRSALPAERPAHRRHTLIIDRHPCSADAARTQRMQRWRQWER